LARSGAYQFYWRGSHSGEGDGYNLYATMNVLPSGATPITHWTGGNSGGIAGSQVNAGGAKVNLYGLGDMVLKDQGYTDVALLGYTSFLYRDGADSGSYGVPRFNFLASSLGANDVDAAYAASGNYVVALDLSQAVVSSAYAITLSTDQRIGFNASAPASGKFSSASGGSYYISKSGARMITVVNGNATSQLYEDRAEVRASVATAYSLRVYADSGAGTACTALGQVGSLSFVSAASFGTDSTQLVFRTAASGVEAESFRVKSSGVIKLAATPTYADNAAAAGGGLAVGDVYQTATGELRIVV
jgi:hypothetical protein